MKRLLVSTVIQTSQHFHIPNALHTVCESFLWITILPVRNVILNSMIRHWIVYMSELWLEEIPTLLSARIATTLIHKPV